MIKELKFAAKNKHLLPTALKSFTRARTINIDYNKDSGKSYNPKVISFRITKACNLSCKMCTFAATDDTKNFEFIEKDVLLSSLKSIKGVKPFISYTGGEPLMHPDIIEILATTKVLGFSSNMVTNGTMLKNKACDVIGTGIDIVAISIDGPKDVHDKIRGKKGAFQSSIDGIRHLIEQKELGSNKKPLVVINSTISAVNQDYLFDIYEIAHSLKVDSINFQYLWFRDDESQDLHNENSLIQLQEYFPELDDALRDINPKLIYRQKEKIKKDKRLVATFFPDLNEDELIAYYDSAAENVQAKGSCKCPWFFSDVDPNGDVIHCGRFVMGNINDSNFKDIWNGNRYRNFRANIRKISYLPICTRCCQYFNVGWL